MRDKTAMLPSTEVAKELGISHAAFKKRRERGKVAGGVCFSGRWFYTKEEVEALRKRFDKKK